MSRSEADVYIIESLREGDKREGEIISRTLEMSGKSPIYRYIRTRSELVHFVRDFEKKGYRYLHFSCHGGKDGVDTTLDDLSTNEFAEIVGPALAGKRLFLSTCEAATMSMARSIFRAGEATSVAGPVNTIYFDDSVILWASFYHLMFKTDFDRMVRADIKENLAKSALLVGQPINFFTRINGDSARPRRTKLPSRPPRSLVRDSEWRT